MKGKLRGIGTILKRTFKAWNAEDPFRQSAVIAYYAIFSLPALLVLIINVAGLFFGTEAVNGEISRQISGIMGDETAESVEEIIAKAGETKAGVISTIIAVVTLLFGATGVFVQLQKTLNMIWDVKQKDGQGIMVELRHRLFSFGLILSIGFLLLVSLVVSSALAAFSHYLEGIFPDVIAYMFYAIEFVVSLAIISTLFLLMFKFLPDVRMKWKYLTIGAVITGLMFMLGKYGLSIYFGKAEPASAYGAAGSVILILLWVSYSSMIVFFGAEFTKQYAVFHGAHVEPTKLAEKVDESCEMPERRQAVSEKRNGSQPAQYLEKKSGTTKTNKYMSTNKSQRKINTMQDVENEIARLEGQAELKKLAIKQQLRPAKVVKDILQNKNVIPRPSNPELAMEGFDFAINFLVDRVILKNANPTVRTLSVYVLREIAKNYAYGRAENTGTHLKELMNLKKRDGQREPGYKRLDDPVDEYYENL